MRLIGPTLELKDLKLKWFPKSNDRNLGLLTPQPEFVLNLSFCL